MGDDDLLIAVARAYHERRVARDVTGAFDAALSEYKRRYPEQSEGTAYLATRFLIFQATERWGTWIYGAAEIFGPDRPSSKPRD